MMQDDCLTVGDGLVVDEGAVDYQSFTQFETGLHDLLSVGGCDQCSRQMAIDKFWVVRDRYDRDRQQILVKYKLQLYEAGDADLQLNPWDRSTSISRNEFYVEPLERGKIAQTFRVMNSRQMDYQGRFYYKCKLCGLTTETGVLEDIKNHSKKVHRVIDGPKFIPRDEWVSMVMNGELLSKLCPE